MSSVNARLLGTPVVLKDEEPVAFPFRKAEALFYYLSVKKQSTRDELVNLLWGEMDEEYAKKNLRHAMYKLRRAFDLDIIISPQKSMVMLNPNMNIHIDVDTFTNDPQGDPALYKGEFLQGFYVKDGEQFEEWMLQNREHIRNLYIHRLYKKIEEGLNNPEDSTIEQYSKLLIAEDPYDERAYRILMKIYGREGAYSKVISIYHRLLETLDKELGIAPDVETKALYDEIMASRGLHSSEKSVAEDFFYGRRQELLKINHTYKGFINGKMSRSLLVLGEAGVGKTKLKDNFLRVIKQDPVYLLESQCYQAEEEFFLKPWNDIFEKLGEIIKKEGIEIPLLWKNIISYIFPIFGTDSNVANINPVERIDPLKYQVAEEAIIGVFKKVCSKKKLVLVFEDIQWMDQMSLSLLASILLRQQNKNIFMISTCRNVYGERVDKFIASMAKYEGLEKLEIGRFNLEEAEEFAKQALPTYDWTKDLIMKIYEETEGNAFFMVEVLNTLKEKGSIGEISSQAQDIIKSRFLGLSEMGKRLVNMASLFFDKVSLEMLKALSEKEELEILDIMEELLGRYILKESGEPDQISYEFTHQKLREYVYMQQSMARRKVLHDRVGKLLEETLHHNHRDRFIYPRLIYHFRNGGNTLQTLKYMIKTLDIYFDFSHEQFPVLIDGNIEGEKYYCINPGEAVRQLHDIELLFQQVPPQERESSQMKALEIAFLHMKGRYLIRQGDYEEGIQCIEKMIEEALSKMDYEYALKGYRQMTYYCIQTHKIEAMKTYLERGLELAAVHGFQKETGILLRLKGLYKIMCGLYVEAEEILKQSIGLFHAINQHENKYSLNIAAGYNYIGEIHRYNMKFSSALEYYEKAMAICQDKKIMRGLTTFYTNAGQAAFDMGDYHRAKSYFQKAMGIYNQLDNLWGRSTAEGYLAILLIKDGNYQDALEHLKQAERYAEKLKSPYEMGLVYRVKAEIKSAMKNNKNVSQIFGGYLDLDLVEYCNRGIGLLKELKDSYEADILEVLKKDRG